VPRPIVAGRPVPEWLVDESFDDRPAGVLKSGKEAEVFLVERESADGSCLLAHKRYRPRYPKMGELRELGFSKGTIYRADKVYRAGWNLKQRDRRAVDMGSRHGHEVSSQMWPNNELAMLQRAWRAGASVPYPVSRTDDGVLMEFIGERDQAAPRLVNAHLSAADVESAREQILSIARDSSETEQSWAQLLRGLRCRGMPAPIRVHANGKAPRAIAAATAAATSSVEASATWRATRPVDGL